MSVLTCTVVGALLLPAAQVAPTFSVQAWCLELTQSACGLGAAPRGAAVQRWTDAIAERHRAAAAETEDDLDEL